MLADGLHARVDGLTSLAVVAGAGGVAAGFPAADPIVGLPEPGGCSSHRPRCRTCADPRRAETRRGHDSRIPGASRGGRQQLNLSPMSGGGGTDFRQPNGSMPASLYRTADW